MPRPPLWTRVLLLAGALSLLVGVYAALVRPWLKTWGATRMEATEALPGDELLAGAADRTTRAITIDAPPSAVWPWLAQLGQDRGGFYSYELLEDLVGTEMENADRILPDRQGWKPGDKLWMYPPEKLDGGGGAALLRVEEGKLLVFGTRQIGTSIGAPYDGIWAFLVQPLDGGRTRFLVRGAGAGGLGLAAAAFTRAVFEPVHFVMERKMMEGIKLLAEGGHPSEASDVAQVILWAITCLLFLIAAVRLLRGSRWPRALVALVTAGGAFQILTFVQPPLLVGVLLVYAITLMLWWKTLLPPIPGVHRRHGVPAAQRPG